MAIQRVLLTRSFRRQHGDERRRNEEDRVRLGQRQVLEAEGEQRQHENTEHCAPQMQHPAHLENGPEGAAPPDVEQHQRQGG
jgi:hypothetical protein